MEPPCKIGRLLHSGMLIISMSLLMPTLYVIVYDLMV